MGRQARAWRSASCTREQCLNLIFINRYFAPDISATSQLLTDLALHLVARGHGVSVITSPQLYDAPGAQLARMENLQGVAVHRVGAARFGRANLAGRAFDYLSFCRAAARKLEEIALHGDIVVAKTDPPMLGAFVSNAVQRRGARLVNWLQDLFPEVAQRAGVPLAGLFKPRRDSALQAAAMNVAVGEGMARYLVAHCYVGSERVRVIPNWADGEALRPIAHPANPLRRKWASEAGFVVAYSGNLGRVHEHETMLGAMRSLRDREDITFLFIGAGSGLARLRQDATGLKNARFLPYQERSVLSHSLGAADVHLCVLRSEFEDLVVPSKFYGIAAAGRATVFVGSREGEIARILVRHDIGLTVNPGDAGGLAAALIDLKENPERRLAMGARARQAFEREYDKPLAMTRWETGLREVLKAGN